MSKDLKIVGGAYGAMLDDGLVNFDGSPEQKTEAIKAAAQGKTFSITISNPGVDAIDEQVYLSPSMLVGEKENGHLLSSLSIGGKKLIISSPNGETTELALKALFRYIEDNPSALLGIRLASTSEDQMNKSITVKTQVNPFLTTFPSRIIQIQDNIDHSIDSGRVAMIKQVLNYDRESQIILTVAPGTVNITLYIDDALNIVQAKRAQLANKFK